MTGKMRDRLWGGLIGTGSTIITSIVVLWFTGVVTNAQARKKLIESKADKVELEKLKIENAQEHREIKEDLGNNLLQMEKRMKDYYDIRHEDLKDFMLSIRD